ncbi:MAG: hypothetical protein ACI4OG_00985 [Bacilli bacterium]
MKFIREHKITTIVIIAFILGVIILFMAWRIFFSNSGNPVYGNRLDGIEEVEITQSEQEKIKESIKKDEKVEDVSLNVSGRTLDIVITVDSAVSLKDAKKIGANSYSELTEDQVDYYSVQVFIKKNDEKQNNFPIIGYKQRGTKELVWTKDREVTTANED